MSMSTHVVGFVPPDEEWKKMKAIWDACDKAGVEVPEAVADFFGGEKPDPEGVEYDMGAAVREYERADSAGFEVEVAKIPKHVKTIRFYNSW